MKRLGLSTTPRFGHVHALEGVVARNLALPGLVLAAHGLQDRQSTPVGQALGHADVYSPDGSIRSQRLCYADHAFVAEPPTCAEWQQAHHVLDSWK